jgi:hypothetical protein
MFRIQSLEGSVIKLGSWSPTGQPLYGVRLRATVCMKSSRDVYPDFGITHFLLAGVPQRRWQLVRRVFDRPTWLVPLGEGWRGKDCGPVEVTDPIPPTHYGGVEQLGNPYSCYGAAFTIKAGAASATKRLVVQCGGISSRGVCAPRALLDVPWTVGQPRRVAVKRLSKAGFHVTVFPDPSPKPGVRAGTVTGQDPSRAVRMCRGAEISLVVAFASK